MKFRYARHTNDIKAITKFYTGILGFEILGSFENHSSYNGIFIGLPDTSWHIEFTESQESANHKADDDDLLVFYVDKEQKLLEIRKRIEENNISLEIPKNPYWQLNGIFIKDPDGFGIILTLEKK